MCLGTLSKTILGSGTGGACGGSWSALRRLLRSPSFLFIAGSSGATGRLGSRLLPPSSCCTTPAKRTRTAVTAPRAASCSKARRSESLMRKTTQSGAPTTTKTFPSHLPHATDTAEPAQVAPVHLDRADGRRGLRRQARPCHVVRTISAGLLAQPVLMGVRAAVRAAHRARRNTRSGNDT